MSIKVMSYIWEHSPHKGSELITLLAIADYADDQGIAYPSIASLSHKTRMTERNVDHVLKKLVQRGALSIVRQAGPHRSNLYAIHFSTSKTGHGEKFSGGEGEKFSPPKDEKFSPSKQRERPLKTSSLPQQDSGMVKSFQGGRVKNSAEEMTPVFTQTIIRDPSEDKTKPADLSPPTPLKTENVCERQAIEQMESAFTTHTPGFKSLCAVYPANRQEGLHEAWQTWQARDLEPRTPEIVAKVVRLTETTWRQREPRYIPLLKTWLDKGRYNDALVEPDSTATAPINTLSAKGQRTLEASKRLVEEIMHGPAGQSPLLSGPQHHE